MDGKITIRSDRKDDYTFQYKGEDVTLKAGSIVSIADGLSEVVFPTCIMKIYFTSSLITIRFLTIFIAQVGSTTSESPSAIPIILPAFNVTSSPLYWKV